MCQLHLGSVTEEGEGMDVGRKVAPIVAARECEKEPDYCPRDFSTKEQRVAAVGRRVFSRGGVQAQRHEPGEVFDILSDLSTMTRPSWVAPRAWLSFIELDKAVVLV